jgi:L-lysine exporter family protein LysE/ArgO
MSTSLGPVFFTLIKNSIDNGIRSALYIALGVVIGDTIILGAIYSGSQFVPVEGSQTKLILQIAGGLLVIGLGLAAFFTKPKITEVVEVRKKSGWLFFAKGFFLNLLNPSNYLGWVLTITLLISWNFTPTETNCYLVGNLLSIYGTEILVAYFAIRLKEKLTPNSMVLINKFLGLMLIVIGGVILFGVKLH